MSKPVRRVFAILLFRPVSYIYACLNQVYIGDVLFRCNPRVNLDLFAICDKKSP